MSEVGFLYEVSAELQDPHQNRQNLRPVFAELPDLVEKKLQNCRLVTLAPSSNFGTV
jgi:hypothetical protein